MFPPHALASPSAPSVYNANLGVPLGGAVYPLFSMANHSCSPNAAVTFAFRRGKPPLVSLRAMTAIAPGEAITISYAPTSSSLTSQPLPTPLRRRTQLASHYFVCCCPMCEPPVPMAAAHVPRDTGGDVRCIPIYSTVSDCSVAGLSCAYIDALSAAILSCRAKSSGSGPNPAGNALQPRCDGLLVPVVFRLPQRGVGGVALLAALECTGCGRCVPVSLSGAAQPATAATGDAPDETVPQIEVPGSLAARLGLIPGKSGVRTVAGSVLVRLLSHFWRLTQSTAQLLSDRPIAARSTVFEPVDVGESVATFAASVSGLIQQLKALSESQAPKSQLLPLMQRLRAEGGRLVGCVSSLATALAAFEGRITPAQAMAAAGISPAGEAWEGEEKADSTLSFPIGVSQREYEAARTEFLADPSNNGSRAGPASASGRGSAAGADDDTPPPFEALESQFEANKVHAARVRRVRFVTRSGGDATAAPEAAASSVESCQLAVTAVLPLPIAVTPGPRQGDPSGTVGADRLRLRGQLGALKDMFTPRQKLEELTAADATWMARGGLPSSHAEAAPLLLSILASGGRAMSQQQRADLAELVQLALGYARAGPASEPLLDDVSLAALFAEALTIGAQLQTQSERTPEPDPPQRPQSSQAEAKTDSPGIPAGFELIFADSNPVEMTHTLEALRYASGVGAPPDASAMAANPRSRARVAAALGDPDRVNSGNVALLAALFPSVAQIDRLLDRNRDKHALSAASDFNETAAVLKAFEPMAQRLSRPDKQLTREPRCVDGEVLSDAAGRLLKVEEFGSGGAGDTPSRFVAAPLISPLHRWRLELLCSLSALTELALDWPDPGAPVAPLQPLCLAATEAALATLGQSPGHPLNPLGAPAIRLALPEPPAEASEGKQTALPDLVGKTFFALSGRASAALSALRQSPASRVQRRAWLLDPRFDAAGAVARGRVRGESPTPLTWTLGFNEISALTPIVLRINGTEAAYASVQALKCMAKLSVWLSETVRFPRHIGRSLRPAVGGSAATGTRNLAGTAVDNVWPSDSDHLGTNKDRVSFQQLLEETTAAMSLASSGSSVVRRS